MHPCYGDSDWRHVSNSQPLASAASARKLLPLHKFILRQGPAEQIALQFVATGGGQHPRFLDIFDAFGVGDTVEDDDEFVAAEAAHRVAEAHGGKQAARVIDVLETIKIDEQHHYPVALPVGLLQGHAQAFDAQREVRQIGEHVMMREVADALPIGLVFADVVRDGDEVGDLVVLFAHGVDQSHGCPLRLQGGTQTDDRPGTGGCIISISSLAGRSGGVSVGPAYVASKAAVIGLTRHLARKVARDRITVNAVAPGTTETDIIKGFTADEMVAINNSIPLGRLGKPEEIAETAAFLASDSAAFITSAVIDINGGMYMG